MYSVLLLLSISVGAVSSCAPGDSNRKPITMTTSNFKTLPSKWVSFNSFEDGITEVATDSSYAKDNIRDFAAKVVKEAAKSLKINGLNPSSRQFDVEFEHFRCPTGVLFGTTLSAELNNTACVVENNVLIGTCKLKADCTDKTKLTAIDSKYLTTKIIYTPSAPQEAIIALAKQKKEFETKVKEEAAKTYPLLSGATFTFSDS